MILQKSLAIPPFYLLIALSALLVAVLVPMLYTSPLLLAGILGGGVALIVAIVVFKQPTLALFAFVLLLPFHSLLMTLLLAQVGLPVGAVRVAAAWKESLLILTALLVFLRIMLRRRLAILTWVDGIALLWLTQILFYFLVGSLIPTWHPTLAARVYGLRDWLLYLLPYFIGRLIPVSDRNAQRILKTILLIGVVTSLYGIVEYFLLPIAFHVQLGVPRYFGEFLGLVYPDYLFGLPPNYWAEVAGRLLRRSVSTYLNGQGFAIPFLVIIPVAFSQYLTQRTRKSLFVFALCVIALLLTITRLTILVCFIQGLVVLLLFRRHKLLVRILVSMIVLLLVVLAANTTFRTFFFDTIFFRDTSSSARPAQWVQGLQTILEQPFGAGLGYAGQTGTRFGGSGVGQEAGYFKITGDLGIPGLLFFLLWFGGLLLCSLNLFRTTVGVWKLIALSTFVTALGFLLNNVTAPPDQSPFVIYVFPFLAGITLRRYSRERIARLQYRCTERANTNVGYNNDADAVALGQL